MYRPAALVVFALMAVSACGGRDHPPLDAVCTSSPGAIERALSRAPAPVTLDGSTRLSDCVSRARSDAELQNAGAVLTGAADHLAVRARGGDAKAGVALGYLVGAARRGAARTPGLQAQLARRMESAAAFVDEGGPAVAAAIERGRRAGRATG
jgi:F0F1-type ATP synthase membrane subunit c/vacuolar-type H+-ATPase subunit K